MSKSENYAGQGFQSAASSLKLHARAKLRSKWDMCTIRRLITWAQVRSGTPSGISTPPQAGLKCLTLVVDCPLIRIFAILIKVNSQLSN